MPDQARSNATVAPAEPKPGPAAARASTRVSEKTGARREAAAVPDAPRVREPRRRVETGRTKALSSGAAQAGGARPKRATARAPEEDALGRELRSAFEQLVRGVRAGLGDAIRVGHVLLKAKEQVGHGRYGKWLAGQCDGRLSKESAGVYKRLAENETAIREHLAAHPGSLAELTIDGARRLLADLRRGRGTTVAAQGPADPRAPSTAAGSESAGPADGPRRPDVGDADRRVKKADPEPRQAGDESPPREGLATPEDEPEGGSPPGEEPDDTEPGRLPDFFRRGYVAGSSFCDRLAVLRWRRSEARRRGHGGSLPYGGQPLEPFAFLDGMAAPGTWELCLGCDGSGRDAEDPSRVSWCPNCLGLGCLIRSLGTSGEPGGRTDA